MVRRHMSIQVEAVKQRLLRHRSLTHHRPTLRMLAMSESVDRRYFKTEFFNTIRRKAAVRHLQADDRSVLNEHAKLILHNICICYFTDGVNLYSPVPTLDDNVVLG